MKALVTGATGFLGGYLVSRLVEDGNEVVALARKTSNINNLPLDKISLVYGDLKDKDSLRQAVDGVDIIYHAGAPIHASWEEFQSSTIQGTETMMELALKAGVTRFVHISSLSVHQTAHLGQNALIDESYPVEPNPEKVGPYAHSKVEAEKIAHQYCERGLPVVIIRPGIIYGPRGIVLFPHIGYTIKGKVFLLVGKGTNLLPLTYIDNVVDAIILASNSDKSIGQVYVIVDDEEITQKEYLKRLISHTNTKLPIISMPFPLILFLMGVVEQARKLGLMKKKAYPSRYGMITKYKNIRFSAAKAKAELNWKPNISLDEGLNRTFDSLISDSSADIAVRDRQVV
jgi:2-alkyl-3-oxoalkanoate reductase